MQTNEHSQCPFCSKEFKTKGIHVHIYYYHTKEGIKARNKLSSKLSKSKGYCLECAKLLNVHGKKFCNHSCAAKHNNRKRGESSWKHSEESKRKIGESSGQPSPFKGKVIVSGKYVDDIKIKKKCPYCNKTFETSYYHPQKYCKSQECIYKHVLATRVLTRRSKSEIRLERLLSKVFDGVVGNDRKVLGGLQLDIVLRKHRIVVEWDGVFHWKPIFGEEKLKSNQEHDQRKTKALLSKDWSIIRVKDNDSESATKEFIRNKFRRIVHLIRNDFNGQIIV